MRIGMYDNVDMRSFVMFSEGRSHLGSTFEYAPTHDGRISISPDATVAVGVNVDSGQYYQFIDH